MKREIYLTSALAIFIWLLHGTASASSSALPLATGPLALPTGASAWMLLIVFGALTIAVAQFLFGAVVHHSHLAPALGQELGQFAALERAADDDELFSTGVAWDLPG